MDSILEQFGVARFKRVADRVRSRSQDYSGLRQASCADEALRWQRQNGTRMLNGNVLRAKVIQGIVDVAGCNTFVETGTSHAATAIGVSRFLRIPVWSCENNPRDYWISRLVTIGMRHMNLIKGDSYTFLRRIVAQLKTDKKQAIFYLDAHEGELDAHSLPLPEEIAIVSSLDSFVVVIDDFRIPDNDNFVFGTYGGVSIEIDLIREGLLKAGIKRCFLPAYSPSKETGFVTGFCMFWRSSILDEAALAGEFPFNLVRPFEVGVHY